MENQLYTALLQKLSQDFSLEENSLPVEADMNLIREHLIERIKELMSRNYERFLNSLYRIDLSEANVHEVLHSKDKLSIPSQLADLIIERQLQRIKTQILYREGKL
ncbi:MAG: hypothetical protein HYS25_11360 [Ignavibacteriales bacterium]|nr:hypothetical protein [Ignavibacteriales bacterium]